MNEEEVPQLTEAEILAKLEDQYDDIDLEADARAREEALDAAEESEMNTSNNGTGLPSLAPVEYSIMRGMGPEGPNRVFIPIWIPTGEEDEEGEPIYRLKVLKKKIGPFTLGVQLEATEALAAMSEDTFRAALVWSFRKGEGDLSADEAVEILEKAYPKKIRLSDGTEHERDPFTPEAVTAMFNGALRGLHADNLESMVMFVAIALRRFNPEITEEWVEDNTDYGMLVRIIGKILSINGGLRDRFLTV